MYVIRIACLSSRASCYKVIFVLVVDKSTATGKSKKRDGTPDKLSSPVGSAVLINQDETYPGPPVGKVISGEDIDSLAINVTELEKVNSIIFPQIASSKLK